MVPAPMTATRFVMVAPVAGDLPRLIVALDSSLWRGVRASKRSPEHAGALHGQIAKDQTHAHDRNRYPGFGSAEPRYCSAGTRQGFNCPDANAAPICGQHLGHTAGTGGPPSADAKQPAAVGAQG